MSGEACSSLDIDRTPMSLRLFFLFNRHGPRRRTIHEFGALAALTLWCVVSSVPSTSAEDFARADLFYMGQGLSYGYDFCGDQDLGRRLRVLIARLADKCPSSEDEREKVSRRLSEADKEMQSNWQEYKTRVAREKAESKPFQPRIFFQGEFACDQGSYRSKASILEEKLDRYDRGEIGEADVEPDLCDQ
jgi:hypothetical protein